MFCFEEVVLQRWALDIQHVMSCSTSVFASRLSYTFICCFSTSTSEAQVCGTCKSSAYCSKACQQVDWPLHKILCKKLAKLLRTSRPKYPTKLGILLSADNPEPKLVWVPYQKPPKPNSSTTYEEMVIHHLLGEPITETIESFNIARNEVRGYGLDHTVVIYARDNWLNDGSKPNQAALALTDWELPYDWRGNVLILSNKGLVGSTVPSPPGDGEDLILSALREGGELEPYHDFQDMTLADFRTAVDYLSRYGTKTKRGDEHSSLSFTGSESNSVSEIQAMMASLMASQTAQDATKKVKGVLIRCTGDIEISHEQTGTLEKFAEVLIAKDHSIWDLPPTPASKIMGLPLLTQKQSHNPAWNPNSHTRFDNQAATFLNLTVDPKVDDGMWGFAPLEWQQEVGSVLLVRKDGKDLSRTQAWALAEFMQHEVSDAFEDAMEEGEEKERRAKVLELLNWKRFDEFLVKFVPDMMDVDGMGWQGCKSPFGTRENSQGQPI
ncbi:hypothetical protein VTL71DRAFT_16393 [Oculimacula yallundae]|uniref:MYND-type domain-containing protein n=1 Tax=Oculimacula yallundae TaxID=86028 RepID=A0ABR4CEC0_9HELO